MKQFDVEKVALSGVNLIEASAGTGKTYTLAELYCRLVLEQQLEVKQILVVTYTRAATEELRGRLRQRLADEWEKLNKLDAKQHQQALTRLQLAIQSFDEAAIYTIHGFCQRVLQDFAFESAAPFDMEMLNDERELQLSVVDDFWRRQLFSQDKATIKYFLKKRITPESLLNDISSLIGKPYVELQAVPEANIRVNQQQFEQQFEQCRQYWQAQRQEAITVLTNKTLLNGNKYRSVSVSRWIEQMDTLMQGEADPLLFDRFEKFTQGELEASLKKGQQLPSLSLWQSAEWLLEASTQLLQAYDRSLQQVRLQLLLFLRTELPRRKQQLHVQAFDDLLLNLQQALFNEECGELLLTSIRQQFHAALIDEFQDTDPVQYTCFSRIFSESNHPVFFVGDPKQAIYSFRGADIFTYLTAKQQAQHEFNLDTNWRSHPLLVAAVNHLFERVDNAFIYEDVPFIPVKAARDMQPALTIAGQAPAPMAWLWLDNEKNINKAEIMQQAAEATADQVALYLNQSFSGDARLLDKQQRALNGGDIAILVRTHKQAVIIQQALRQRGINSVQQSRDSVFASEQAVMLEQVLMAIANPQHDTSIATALATPLLGYSAAAINAMQQDDKKWLQQVDLFCFLNDLWRRNGFIVMFRRLLNRTEVLSRWLQQAEGERQLTNLLHLAELIQLYSHQHHATMEAVLSWLAQQRMTSDKQVDSAQIRLESDEQLVKVMTIHTSKGLEYPIVFCPFLWEENVRSSNTTPVRTYHRKEDNAVYAAFAEPELTQAAEIVAQEQRAEALRLLYVALTRAREHCVVVWAAAKSTEKSALFQLLHPQLDTLDPTQMLSDLEALVVAQPEHFMLKAVTAETNAVMATQVSDSATFKARKYQGKKVDIWSVGSFSSLSSGQHQERPDHDAVAMLAEPARDTVLRQDRFSFPKGARAGSCLHALFENWDFQTTDAAWQQQIENTLNAFGIDIAWRSVINEWLIEVVNTPLDEAESLRLSAVERSQRLDEMAFYFPVNQLSAKRLATCLLQFSDEIPALKPLAEQLTFNMLTGFVNGFIDMVFEHQGTFYIVDYKSNWLGDQFADYHQNALEEAMIQHHYSLQYLLYSLALHRYLRYRLPDYQPEKHLGGVYYLFIRGMSTATSTTGVYHAKPSPRLLEALDQCMSGADK